MKALKKATFGTFLATSIFMLGVAGFNSSIVDRSAFMKNDFGIKLAKRLDEIKGEITIGRMAASVPVWSKAKTQLIKKDVKQILAKKVAPKTVKIEKKKEIAEKNIPAPVVNGDLDLSLTGGFYNKKSLEGKSEFSGSAVVQDGVIEEISVSLPGGNSFSINTNERMVGNVFQYEDTQTREIKSGLFYRVKPGVFMVTLTNDSQYPGLRLEFKASNVELAEEVAPKTGWGLNKQNTQQAKSDVSETEKDFYQNEAQINQYDESENTIDPDVDTVTGFNFNV